MFNSVSANMTLKQTCLNVCFRRRGSSKGSRSSPTFSSSTGVPNYRGRDSNKAQLLQMINLLEVKLTNYFLPLKDIAPSYLLPPLFYNKIFIAAGKRAN